MHQCIVIVDIDNCLEISTRALSVISLSIAPLTWITSSRVLTNCFSVDIPKISMTSEVRPTKSVPWSDRWYRWQQPRKMVSDATASFGKHYGRVRRLNGLNDPMTRHDISSKLRSGLKCLPDLISMTCRKNGRYCVIRLFLDTSSGWSRFLRALSSSSVSLLSSLGAMYS
jgi:hypothetical protein